MKKICFKYWPRENKDDDFFKNSLRKLGCEIVSEKEAEVMFFSSFVNGKNIGQIPSVEFSGKKVFHTGENIRIDMHKCDFAFGFDYEEEINDKNYLRLPLYVYFGAGKNLIKPKNYDSNKILKSKTRFCNYVYSKDAKERVKFFDDLGKYKKVDAPGKSLNNCEPIAPSKLTNLSKIIQKAEGLSGKYVISSLLSRHLDNWREAIINYQKDYKFSIAFENSSYPGYTTEKIYHPMLANSIPIYFGNPEISRDFNTKSFVNYHDYNDFKKVFDVVIDLDSNEKKYLKMLNEPWLRGNKLNKWMDLKRIENQFEMILNE
ncbi:MAG: glycosyltransferase family 10 [Candidatus ainarchaeum sp.]|nr:glycosyltransferase family 10 [Candidatus ainarchaeum sp.]